MNSEAESDNIDPSSSPRFRVGTVQSVEHFQCHLLTFVLVLSEAVLVLVIVFGPRLRLRALSYGRSTSTTLTLARVQRKPDSV
jgi:hypothetical protein